MTRQHVLIVLGILVLLSPWSGIPLALLAWILPVCGITIALLGYSLLDRTHTQPPQQTAPSSGRVRDTVPVDTEVPTRSAPIAFS